MFKNFKHFFNTMKKLESDFNSINDLFHYDSGDDSLTFINKNKDAEFTINTGLVLLSLNKKHQIVALELMGANKNFDIPKSILNNLKKAKVKFDYHKDKKALIINIELFFSEEKPLKIINSCQVEDMINESSTLNAMASS